MRTAAAVLALCTLPAAAASGASGQWSVGYFTPWGNPPIPPEAIEWRALTHVVYAWALARPGGTLDLDTQRIPAAAPALIAAAHVRGVRALLGIAQPYWLSQKDNLPQAASAHRAALVQNILAAVNRYGFDGVDLDWEPFDPAAHGDAARALIADLRARLATRLLTATAIVTGSAFWGTAAAPLDRLSVMTYDLGGAWNPHSWHNSPLRHSGSRLHSVEGAVRRFIAAGVPREKLNIGIPFFGYEFTGGLTGPLQPWPAGVQSRQLYYQAFAARILPPRYRWDAAAQVPYLTGASYLTFDDERSVAAKVAFARANALGGWIIWELAADYLPGRTPNQPLLAAIAEAMR